MRMVVVFFTVLAMQNTAFAESNQTKSSWLRDELRLSDEQRARLSKIEKESAEALFAKRQTMRKAKDTLEAAVKSEESDAQLKEKFQAMQLAENDFSAARFEKVLKIRSLLTSEQRAKFHGLDLRPERRRRQHE